MYIPTSSPFYFSLPLYYVLTYFLIGLRLCHRTFLFLFRYDVQWCQTQRRNLCFFPFPFSFSFLIFHSYHFSFLFFTFHFIYFSTMKAHDFGGGMLFGYGYGCLSYVHVHSRIVTFSGTTLGSLLLFFFNSVSICLKSDQLCWIRYAFLPILEITRR